MIPRDSDYWDYRCVVCNKSHKASNSLEPHDCVVPLIDLLKERGVLK